MLGRDEKCVHNVVCKPEERRPLERPRCTLEDNINMDVKEVGVDWIHLAQTGTDGMVL
jgi:hypothetical protein